MFSKKGLKPLGLCLWKFMFNNVQYRIANRCLLNIFPNKPTSTAQNQYDNTFVFNELNVINTMRKYSTS